MSGISAALVGIHMGVAMMTKHQHWALEETEANAISNSVANVARHYPKIASSQKLVDWAMLVQTVAFMYVPRAMMSRDLIKEKKERQNANV